MPDMESTVQVRTRATAQARARQRAALAKIRGSSWLLPQTAGTRAAVQNAFTHPVAQMAASTYQAPITSSATSNATANAGLGNGGAFNSAGTTFSGGDPNLGGRGSTDTGGGGTIGTTHNTGFASRYSGEGSKMAFGNPEMVIRDTLKSMGYDPDSGIMDLIAGDAGAMQSLLAIMKGSSPGSLNSQDANSFINFVSNYAKNQATPGGEVLDTQALVNQLLNSKDGSALHGILAGGDPSQQASTMNTMIRDSIGNLSPLVQRAIMQTLQDRTTDWESTQARGGKTAIDNYLQQGGHGIWG